MSTSAGEGASLVLFVLVIHGLLIASCLVIPSVAVFPFHRTMSEEAGYALPAVARPVGAVLPLLHLGLIAALAAGLGLKEVRVGDKGFTIVCNEIGAVIAVAWGTACMTGVALAQVERMRNF